MKRRAILWAQAHGYALCATEVRVPRSNFRADVAAVRWAGAPEAVAVFECKQARADFCFLVGVPGLLRGHETPNGWGLLEACGDGLRLIHAPDRGEVSPETRSGLLASIARSAMRIVNRDLGITSEDVVRWQADHA